MSSVSTLLENWISFQATHLMSTHPSIRATTARKFSLNSLTTSVICSTKKVPKLRFHTRLRFTSSLQISSHLRAMSRTSSTPITRPKATTSTTGTSKLPHTSTATKPRVREQDEPTTYPRTQAVDATKLATTASTPTTDPKTSRPTTTSSYELNGQLMLL